MNKGDRNSFEEFSKATLKQSPKTQQKWLMQKEGYGGSVLWFCVDFSYMKRRRLRAAIFGNLYEAFLILTYSSAMLARQQSLVPVSALPMNFQRKKTVFKIGTGHAGRWRCCYDSLAVQYQVSKIKIELKISPFKQYQLQVRVIFTVKKASHFISIINIDGTNF